MQEDKKTAALVLTLIGLFTFFVWYNKYKLSGG